MSREAKPSSTSVSATGSPGGLTELLRAWSDGDERARDRLFDRIYPELHRLSAQRLGSSPGSVSIQATELVNEAYLAFSRQRRIDWQGRSQFFALASTLIRRILCDHAKHRGREKRGGGAVHLQIDESLLGADGRDLDLLALDMALTELAEIRATAARVVELRFYSGLSLEEAAATLGLSRATAARRWRFAKAWLVRRLEADA